MLTDNTYVPKLVTDYESDFLHVVKSTCFMYEDEHDAMYYKDVLKPKQKQRQKNPPCYIGLTYKKVQQAVGWFGCMMFTDNGKLFMRGLVSVVLHVD